MEHAADAKESLRCDLAADVLRRFGELRLQVNGTSMLPSICPGDVLTVHRQNIDHVRCGDIVLFERDDRLYAHRVLKKVEGRGGTLVIARGDALPEEDPPVYADELLGRVTSILRGRSRIDPRNGLTASERLVAWLARQSGWFARLASQALQRGRMTNPV